MSRSAHDFIDGNGDPLPIPLGIKDEDPEVWEEATKQYRVKRAPIKRRMTLDAKNRTVVEQRARAAEKRLANQEEK